MCNLGMKFEISEYKFMEKYFCFQEKFCLPTVNKTFKP